MLVIVGVIEVVINYSGSKLNAWIVKSEEV